MKKILIGFLCSGFLFTNLIGGQVDAAETDNSNFVPLSTEKIVGEDDLYYFVIDESPQIQNRTWSSPQSWSIVKGSRTYLDTITRTKKTSLDISGKIFGMTIKLGNSYSESGKFKRYNQNAKITVTYKVYRKVDNKYVETKTAVANTSYIDYVAIK